LLRTSATGDVLVIPHGDAYYLADPPAAERTYGFEEALTSFRRMAAGELSSTVFEGGNGPATTQFICGFLGCDFAAIQSRAVGTAAPATRAQYNADGRWLASSHRVRDARVARATLGWPGIRSTSLCELANVPTYWE
jgi:hypothetical protein